MMWWCMCFNKKRGCFTISKGCGSTRRACRYRLHRGAPTNEVGVGRGARAGWGAVTIRIVAVGKLKQPAARALVDEYMGRLRRYVRCEEAELRPLPWAKQLKAFDKACGDYQRVALDVVGAAV
ncbi:MAG TPA: hypothetical protein ENK23_02505, partial [Sorangium sp.]|nr:hypothetical protein [Sorangium sp.]